MAPDWGPQLHPRNSVGSNLRLKIGEVLVAHPTDADLVLAAQGGDMDSFEQLYRRYFDRLYDFAVRTIRDRHGAADAVQDTFIKAHDRIGQLRNPESFRPWIFAIVRREAISGFRSRNREAVTSTLDEESAALNPLLVQISDDIYDDPAIAAELSDSATLVWEAAASLDSDTYTMLDLHVRQGLSSAEIADVLQISKGNAYTKLNRMKERTGAAISTYLLIRKGSAECDELAEIVSDVDLPPVSESLRKTVDQHVRNCEICTERRKALVAPLKMFAALGMVPSPADLQGAIWQSVSEASTASASSRRFWKVPAVAALFIAFLGMAAGIAGAFLAGTFDENTAASPTTVQQGSLTPEVDTANNSATESSFSAPNSSTVESGASDEPAQPAPPSSNETDGTDANALPTTIAPATTVVDETPPTIEQAAVSETEIWELDTESLSCPSGTPRTAQISAEIADTQSEFGVVEASWTIAGSPFTVAMNPSGDIYTAQFGPFAYLSVLDNTSPTIGIVIRAQDAVGNETKTTVSLVVNSLAKCFT